MMKCSATHSDDDDTIIEFHGPDCLWNTLRAMAKHSLIESVRFLIESGATKQEVDDHLNNFLLPRMHKWIDENSRFHYRGDEARCYIGP